jgi:hypothetical protein
MLRTSRRLLPAFRAAGTQLSACQSAQPFIPAYAAYSAAPEQSTYNVPEGHWNSDLTDVACNIGLNRRRDLTLRQDLALFKQQSKYSLADVFKVHSRPCSDITSQHLRLSQLLKPDLRVAGQQGVVDRLPRWSHLHGTAYPGIHSAGELRCHWRGTFGISTSSSHLLVTRLALPATATGACLCDQLICGYYAADGHAEAEGRREGGLRVSGRP